MPDQQVLMVAGFHRSGTSMAAQLVHKAGLFLGDDLIGANASNPFGHIEDREVVALHKQVMEAHGDTWRVDGPRIYHLSEEDWKAFDAFVAKRTVGHSLWGFKDPRACMFMGIWDYLIPDARYVIVHRSAAACVDSLHRRHASDLLHDRGAPELHQRFFNEADLGYRMWKAHNEALVQFADHNRDRVIVLSVAQLRRGYPLVEELRGRYDLPLAPVRTGVVYDPSSMRAEAEGPPIFDARLKREIADLEAQLTAMSEESDV